MKPTIYKGYEIYVSLIGGKLYYLIYDDYTLIYGSNLSYKNLKDCIAAAKHYIDTLIDLYTA